MNETEDKVTLRPMKGVKEAEKLKAIIGRAGRLTPPYVMPSQTYVLTERQDEGEAAGKVWILGTVSLVDDKVAYLAVEPNHRRKGYGRKLLKYAINNNYSQDLYLHVGVTNYKAIKLYRSEGFVPKRLMWRRWGLALRMVRHSRSPLTKLKVGKLYSVDLDIPITPSIMKQVERYIGTYTPVARNCATLLRELDYESDWGKWVVNHGKYRGTWPKRFSAAYHERFGVFLSDDTVRDLGTCITHFNGTVHFVLNKTVDWEAGDFGDRGSCMFDSNGEYVNNRVFEQGLARAIKIYKDEKAFKSNPYQGIGRAYLSPRGEELYVWNAYGKLDSNVIALAIAKVIGFNVTEDYKFQSPFYNNGDSMRISNV